VARTYIEVATTISTTATAKPMKAPFNLYEYYAADWRHALCISPARYQLIFRKHCGTGRSGRMRLRHVVAILVAGAFACSVQLGASQYGGAGSSQPKGKAGAAAKEGKEKASKAGGVHTMTGCLAKGTEPNTYMLNSIEGAGPKQAELINVPASLKLDAHVGHKVAITGTDVSTRAAARAEAGTKKPSAAQQKQEASEHHVTPTALKMISTSCM
jgi:hypothetical protein